MYSLQNTIESSLGTETQCERDIETILFPTLHIGVTPQLVSLYNKAEDLIHAFGYFEATREQAYLKQIKRQKEIFIREVAAVAMSFGDAFEGSSSNFEEEDIKELAESIVAKTKENLKCPKSFKGIDSTIYGLLKDYYTSPLELENLSKSLESLINTKLSTSYNRTNGWNIMEGTTIKQTRDSQLPFHFIYSVIYTIIQTRISPLNGMNLESAISKLIDSAVCCELLKKISVVQLRQRTEDFINLTSEQVNKLADQIEMVNIWESCGASMKTVQDIGGIKFFEGGAKYMKSKDPAKQQEHDLIFKMICLFQSLIFVIRPVGKEQKNHSRMDSTGRYTLTECNTIVAFQCDFVDVSSKAKILKLLDKTVKADADDLGDIFKNSIKGGSLCHPELVELELSLDDIESGIPFDKKFQHILVVPTIYESELKRINDFKKEQHFLDTLQSVIKSYVNTFEDCYTESTEECKYGAHFRCPNCCTNYLGLSDEQISNHLSKCKSKSTRETTDKSSGHSTKKGKLDDGYKIPDDFVVTPEIEAKYDIAERILIGEEVIKKGAYNEITKYLSDKTPLHIKIKVQTAYKEIIWNQFEPIIVRSLLWIEVSQAESKLLEDERALKSKDKKSSKGPKSKDADTKKKPECPCGLKTYNGTTHPSKCLFSRYRDGYTILFSKEDPFECYYTKESPVKKKSDKPVASVPPE